jgi:hypothetical protein
VPDSLPPVTIRVTRPYATEDELLESELETMTRTSVTLLGAQPRPQGLVLRFELLLASGQTLMRGEGRVVGYRPDAYYGTGGLTLRFTRLDSRSKALVDKAAALRDRLRPSAAPPGDIGSPSLAPSSIAPASIGPLSIAPSDDERQLAVPLPEGRPPADPHPRDPTVNMTLTLVAEAPPIHCPPAGRDRNALLDRLRARSKCLDEATVQKILEGQRG